jgi:hypothetical protein
MALQFLPRFITPQLSASHLLSNMTSVVLDGQVQDLASDEQMLEICILFSKLKNARQRQMNSKENPRTSYESNLLQGAAKIPAPQRFVRKQKSKKTKTSDNGVLTISSSHSATPTTIRSAANSFEDLYDTLLDAVMYPRAADHIVQSETKQ